MRHFIHFMMKRFPIKPAMMAAIISLFSMGCSSPAGDETELETGFVSPPASAAPRVWWHWMNGNITKEGIRADLEWMHRIGIGGFQNFDAALNTPQIVEKRLVYMTPEWKEAFRFTTQLADSLGLEMAIAGSPGWSESGGPWVTPTQAMKKLVWSETRLEGGKPFSGFLTKPPSTTGPFQNIPSRDRSMLTDQDKASIPEFYADAAVVAYRIPEADIALASLQPKVTSSGGEFILAALTDGDLGTSSLLPFTRPGENAWIQFEFPEPQTVHALTIVGGGYGGRFGFGADPDNRALEAGNDGRTFEKVMNIPRAGVGQRTLSFDPVTARFFRFTWKTPQPPPSSNPGSTSGFNLPSNTQAGTRVAELVLHTVPRINRFEEKAAFLTATDLYKTPSPAVKTDGAIQRSEVKDLSSLMKPDGMLVWTPPPGNWMVLRLGYSLTGHQNSPASPEATGLEVDKLSADHVRAYFTNYLDQYKNATGGLMGRKGLQYVITDSWEAGVQNWTDRMIGEFNSRRGYNIIPWLPVLTGRIVESSEASERFLWDFRKTIGDLTTENHYDQLTDLLAARYMARYTESHESGRAFIGDGMEVKRKAAIPMSATWTPGGWDPGTEVATRYKADVRESASVAHLYGQNLVAAESMTAIGTAWAWSPELLKPTADMEMAHGLNRFVIHTSVHQPVNDKIPGLGLGPFGQWFTRHETWAEQAAPWITYLSRSCFMLQQGQFVADILYFYGEDNNITALFGNRLPDVPDGYNYDFVNADALVNLLSVSNGLITTKSGMKYHILALDSNSMHMSLPVLHKISDLVHDGAYVVGPEPVTTPSLSDDGNQFTTLVNQLWVNESGLNSVGKGKVFAGQSLTEALKTTGVIPDLIYNKPEQNTRLLFVHRRTKDADLYWVNNRNNRVEDTEATFRIKGKKPEIWHPGTGAIEMASYSMEGEITKVKLHLQPNDAIFVVFRQKTAEKMVTLPEVDEKTMVVLDGSWELAFQPNRGAPAKITCDSLFSWKDHPDPGIKYFSGTAAYTKTFTAPEGWNTPGTECWLDPGNVKNLAEVLVNGKSLGIVWKAPFRVNMSGVLKEGENNLEIRVTNLWVNRLIGDQQPDVTAKITYTTMPFYRADSPLLPSGLLGPVKIVSVKRQ